MADSKNLSDCHYLDVINILLNAFRLKKNEFFKIANSQKMFAKISEIGSWISRID